MEIIAAIGAGSTQGLQTHAFDADFRLKSLDAPETGRRGPAPQGARARPASGPSSLALLAEAWLARGRVLVPLRLLDQPRPPHALRPVRQLYYSNYDPFSPEMMARQRGMPMAVKVADVVKNSPATPGSPSSTKGSSPSSPPSSPSSTSRSARRTRRSPTSSSSPPPTPQGQGAGRGVRPGLDQEPRPQLAAVAAQPVLLRLRVRQRAEGIPLTRSKQERNLRRAGRLGQAAAAAADRRDRREAADQGVHHLPQHGGGVSAGRDREGLRLVRRASGPRPWPSWSSRCGAT